MLEDLLMRGMSLVGLFVIVGLAWLMSENKKAIAWRLVFWGMGLQLALGLLILRTPVGIPFFLAVKMGFDVVTNSAEAGAQFLFGNLTQFFMLNGAMTPGPHGLETQDIFTINAVVAFKVLPVIIFVSGLAAILQHLRVIQVVVKAMSWLMRRTLKTSGAETFATSLLVFLGIESLSAVNNYMKNMTRSELFTLMTAFLATIAASVMVAYASFGAEPGHLLAASLMSAPAAIAMSKILVPETETPETAGTADINMPVESHNVFDAASRGASLGLTMALQVGALLIVFVGLIFLLDLISVSISGVTLTALLSWLFRPFALILGIPFQDVTAVSQLLATKSIFNEFLAYEQLQSFIQAGSIQPRSITIATYALCGFANPGSLGIMIGAMSGIIPERRELIARLSMRAFVAGTLACFTTACVAGILMAA